MRWRCGEVVLEKLPHLCLSLHSAGLFVDSEQRRLRRVGWSEEISDDCLLLCGGCCWGWWCFSSLLFFLGRCSPRLFLPSPIDHIIIRAVFVSALLEVFFGGEEEKVRALVVRVGDKGIRFPWCRPFFESIPWVNSVPVWQHLPESIFLVLDANGLLIAELCLQNTDWRASSLTKEDPNRAQGDASFRDFS